MHKCYKPVTYIVYNGLFEKYLYFSNISIPIFFIHFQYNTKKLSQKLFMCVNSHQGKWLQHINRLAARCSQLKATSVGILPKNHFAPVRILRGLAMSLIVKCNFVTSRNRKGKLFNCMLVKIIVRLVNETFPLISRQGFLHAIFVCF